MSGIVTGITSVIVGTGSSSTRIRGVAQESDASSINSGSKGDKSATHKVNGTRRSFNAKGNGSIIVEDASINSGYCAGNGNVNKLALQNDPFEECNGTDESFNVDEGGKINLIRGSLNSGAFSGSSVPR